MIIHGSRESFYYERQLNLFCKDLILCNFYIFVYYRPPPPKKKPNQSLKGYLGTSTCIFTSVDTQTINVYHINTSEEL